MFHVKGVTTPTLIQHGERDERVPLSQGEELYNALKRQGCTTKMVIYPRTHHGIEEPRLLRGLHEPQPGMVRPLRSQRQGREAEQGR